MTRIKLCGLRRPEDIEAANLLLPEYVGFVFAPGSRRYISPEQAGELKGLLDKRILAVGVFADEAPERIAELLNRGVIDAAQLHGGEDDDAVLRLKRLTGKPVIKAFRIRTPADAGAAEASSADHVLLDSGAGTGETFDWQLIRGIRRPYFLAGGLTPENAEAAVRRLRPFAVDVSSGIETDGWKDPRKMAAFIAAVRKVDES